MRGSALGFFGFAIIKPVAFARGFADAIFMIQADVKPHGRIEGTVLIDTQPGQFVIKNFAIGLAEITIGNSPVGDGAGDAVDELADGGFALGSILFAVKV